jgi:hypothetical protein
MGPLLTYSNVSNRERKKMIKGKKERRASQPMSWQQIHLQPRRRWPNVQSREDPRASFFRVLSRLCVCWGARYHDGPENKSSRTLFIYNKRYTGEKKKSDGIQISSMTGAERNAGGARVVIITPPTYCAAVDISPETNTTHNSDRFSSFSSFLRRPASRREKVKS